MLYTDYVLLLSPRPRLLQDFGSQWVGLYLLLEIAAERCAVLFPPLQF